MPPVRVAPSRIRPRRPLAALATAAALTATVVLAGPGPAGAAVVFTAISPTGSATVQVKGNGHGHGMSQYGARGAAIAGLTYPQILAFYYPGTTLTTLRTSWIRVGLSGPGATTTVLANPHLTMSGGIGVLPATHVRRYRLVADSGSGLSLQRLTDASGAAWTNYRTGLPDGSYFHRADSGPIRLGQADGSSTDYYGALSSWRVNPTGRTGGVHTVDRVTIDHYTAGVAPREMPSSWETAATQAQAVAARSYGRYAVEHPRASTYDICDTTSCQVYGGSAHYYSDGSLAYTDAPAMVAGDANQVLRYGGATIFAEFGASNGGWATDGGQPYLAAHADRYDNTASSDPYLQYTDSTPSRDLASYFGLRTVTGIAVTARDGNGTWGGRVTSALVRGTNSSGKAVQVTASGSDLQWAFGVGSSWLRVVG